MKVRIYNDGEQTIIVQQGRTKAIIHPGDGMGLENPEPISITPASQKEETA